MKIREVIKQILAHHPDLGDSYNGCDAVKCGDVEALCSGVLVAMAPSVKAIQKAIDLKANLILVHEPTFYTSMDNGWYEDFDNEVLETKLKMCEDHGIVIYRDHDHMHASYPDGIFYGVLKHLGWLDFYKEDTSTGLFTHFIVDLPESVTLKDLLSHMVDTIGICGTRYMGNLEMPVKRIALVGHLYPMMLNKKNSDGSNKEYSVQIMKYLEEDIDVIIPGEIIDWTVMSYLKDAIQLGKNKGMINLGHYHWEELGMKYTAEWVKDSLKDDVEVHYYPLEDMYQFFTK